MNRRLLRATLLSSAAVGLWSGSTTDLRADHDIDGDCTNYQKAASAFCKLAGRGGLKCITCWSWHEPGTGKADVFYCYRCKDGTYYHHHPGDEFNHCVGQS